MVTRLAPHLGVVPRPGGRFPSALHGHQPDLVDRDLLGRSPRRYPRHLPIEICLLIGRRHPGVHRRPRAGTGCNRKTDDQDQPAYTLGRYRQQARTEPAVHRHTRNTVTRATPLRSAHTAKFIPQSLQHTTDNYRPLNPQQLAAPLMPLPRRRVWHDDLVPTRHRTHKRLLTLALLLLVAAPSLIGCVRIRASITVSPDDRVSGQIVAAAKARDADDKGPQLLNSLPFARKVAVSEYSRDDYVGTQAVFSDLTFAELPQLANMNRDAAGVDISLRRAGDLVILEGRVDLTSLSDSEADVSLTVSFPGEVTSTNGDQISTQVVAWKLRPGVVSTMNAQARYTDPSARSFTGAAIWLGLASFLVAGIIGALAYASRDRSPRVGEP